MVDAADRAVVVTSPSVPATVVVKVVVTARVEDPPPSRPCTVPPAPATVPWAAPVAPPTTPSTAPVADPAVRVTVPVVAPTAARTGAR